MKQLAWRSKDGTNIILSSGIEIYGEKHFHDKEWIICFNGAIFGGYKTESQMHFALDALWESIGYAGYTREWLGDANYEMPVAPRSELLKECDEKLEHLGEYSE